MNVHLRGAFLMTKAVQAHMIDAEVRPDRQPLVDLRAGQPRAGQLLRRQGRAAGLHQDAGDRAGPVQRHGQRRRAGLHRHRHDPADGRADEGQLRGLHRRGRRPRSRSAGSASPRTSPPRSRSSPARRPGSSPARSSTSPAAPRTDRPRRSPVADPGRGRTAAGRPRAGRWPARPSAGPRRAASARCDDRACPLRRRAVTAAVAAHCACRTGRSAAHRRHGPPAGARRAAPPR